jgi:hypothetical protein
MPQETCIVTHQLTGGRTVSERRVGSVDFVAQGLVEDVARRPHAASQVLTIRTLTGAVMVVKASKIAWSTVMRSASSP